MFKFTILLIALIPALALAQNVRPCAGVGTPTQVRVAGCNAGICRVRSGNVVQVQADFVTPHAATSIAPAMRIALGPIFINYNLNMANACPHLSRAQCPLTPNAASTFHLSFPINPAYPPTQIAVELTLRNHANVPMVCGIVDFVIYN